ncbi:MAG: iron ABC transporter permease [Bacteroidales bacterium]|jgi:iron complex transport system permease protein|nr:iron ABC transporter permease [Bacteroidales bacterium]
MAKHKTNSVPSEAAILVLLLVILTATALASFSVGRYSIGIFDILRYVFSGTFLDENVPVVITEVRMPRIIGAILAGGALSVSGAACQGLFRNPMVSPDILGVSSGAGFGAAIAILLSMSLMWIQVSAFLAGILAVCTALFVSRIIGSGHDRILMLVLSGMIVASLFSALISLMKYIADSDFKLPDITFWLMGSLSGVSMSDVRLALPVTLIAIVPLFLSSWKLNVLSFGEEEAKTLGVNTARLRTVIICCTSLLTASVVCITGMIGWVGLIVPHFARFITGPNHKILLPASFLIGSTFMLLVDDLARSISSLEIPLGIITALVGAPVFLALLKVSSKRAWQ